MILMCHCEGHWKGWALKSRLFGPWNGNEQGECHNNTYTLQRLFSLPFKNPKKSRLSGPTPSNGPHYGFPSIQINTSRPIKTTCTLIVNTHPVHTKINKEYQYWRTHFSYLLTPSWLSLSCVVDQILQEFNILFLVRFRICKISTPPQTKTPAKTTFRDWCL